MTIPDKSLADDPIPIPTSVLKQIDKLVASFITDLFNRSLSKAIFQPALYRYIREELDVTDTSFYRPISDLLYQP